MLLPGRWQPLLPPQSTHASSPPSCAMAVLVNLHQHTTPSLCGSSRSSDADRRPIHTRAERLRSRRVSKWADRWQRYLRGGHDSAHRRHRCRVLQKSVLGTADGECWRRLGVRSFLFNSSGVYESGEVFPDAAACLSGLSKLADYRLQTVRKSGEQTKPGNQTLCRRPRAPTASDVLPTAGRDAGRRVPRHFGKREHPKNACPASRPCRARRRTIRAPHFGHFSPVLVMKNSTAPATPRTARMTPKAMTVPVAPWPAAALANRWAARHAVART